MLMIWKGVIVTLLVSGLLDDKHVNARPDGLKLDAACDQMIPSHGVVAQSSPPPYSISFSPETYTPGSTVSVTIASCTPSLFKGFMIQARRATKTADQSEMLGAFTPVAGTQFICGGKALDHTSRTGKTSLTFQWTPPSTTEGHVQFWVTFVQDYSTFWAAVKSDVLKDGSISLPVDSATVTSPTVVDATCNGGPAPTTDVPVPGSTAPTGTAGKVSLPAECGTDIGCVSKSCSDSSCETVVSWKEDGDYVLYTLSSVVSSKSYLALGFSSDSDMGDDSVSGCASAADGTVQVFNAETTGETRPTMFDDSDVTLQDYSINDNVMSCTIKRLKTASANGKRYDVTKKWVILFAQGSAKVDGQKVTVEYHKGNKFHTSGKFSSDEKPNVGGEESEHLMVKIHGSLMMGAWIFLASIGIIAARYYKPVWEDNCCSQKVWFQIHRSCMVAVFCATIAGFIIIVLEEGWGEITEGELHPVLGLVVTILTVINPFMALLRPKPGAPNRYIFNWAHWFVGTASHILGVVTIFFGVQLDEAGLPDYTIYILAGYVGWQVLIALVLEVIHCCGQAKAREELYEVDDLQQPLKEPQKTISMKRVLLMLHVLVLAAIVAVLISFLIIGEEDLEL